MAEGEEQFLSEETGADFDGADEYEAEKQFHQDAAEYGTDQPYEADQRYDDGTEQFEGSDQQYAAQQYEGAEQYEVAEQYQGDQQYNVGSQEYGERQEMDATEQLPQEQGEQGEHIAESAEGRTEENTDETGEQISGNASRKDDDERKIFVGGLSWETTGKDLKEYFEKFGKVVDCTLKTDPSTGRSRGFGFVLFDSVSSVDKVIEEKAHILHNKNIDPKRAMVRGGRSDACKKVFVGGVSPDMPESEIREYFGKFGKIDEIELPFDRVKNQRRAYVFISYESEEVVERVIAESKQMLGGKEVDVRKATPRGDGDGFGRGRGGPGQHGRGRGRGAYPGQAAAGYYPDGTSAAAVPPTYDYSSYYNYGQGYGGYAYPGYGYPGYDYSSYYGQAADWSNYQQSYSQSYPGGYYDYSSWYGQDQTAQSAAGKTKRGGTGASYHPYSR